MATSDEQTPSEFARSAAASAWNTIRTVYWANSPGWRLLKAGSLLFMGFFLWAGSNVMFSYRPGWTPLQYTMAYGFIVIAYGPIHHLVVIPLALRWRRAAGRRQAIGKRLPDAGLALFLVGVVVLGTFPPGAMVVNFQSALGDGGADIAPDLQCVKSDGENGTVVHCHLSESRGVDNIEVRSGDEVVLTDEDAPYEFSVEVSELNEVMGEKKFTVALLDEDGDLVRRYTRRVNMINEG